MAVTGIPGGQAAITIRNDLRPGDLGGVVSLHGVLYAEEYGFDPTFEAYVAGPLAEFARRRSHRERLWIAECDSRLVGCVAVVAGTETEAQLRWFLVHPSCRGVGLGKRLLREAVVFARQSGYQAMFLWTVSALTAAARLYRAQGFAKVEEQARVCWGVAVVEERYRLAFECAGPAASGTAQ
jgi:ribosomal protein S18 acetylase RimI-like enzyme